MHSNEDLANTCVCEALRATPDQAISYDHMIYGQKYSKKHVSMLLVGLMTSDIEVNTYFMTNNYHVSKREVI